MIILFGALFELLISLPAVVWTKWILRDSIGFGIIDFLGWTALWVIWGAILGVILLRKRNQS